MDGELVLIVEDDHILVMVGRDKRSIWEKIMERSRQCFNHGFPTTIFENGSQLAGKSRR